MPTLRLSGRAKVWLWDGKAAWHFITLPRDLGDQVKEIAAGMPRGWGSVRVRATVGKSTWDTSVFPYAKAKSFVLPLKKEVRANEGLAPGKSIDFKLEVKL